MSTKIGAFIATSVGLHDLARVPNTDSGTAYETAPLQLAIEARKKGYDSVCMPLTTEKWKTRWSAMCLLPPGADREDTSAEKLAEAWRSKPAFLREEVTMSRLDEAEGVTVLASEWLELDAGDDWVRHDAEIALKQELAYASYLNVQNLILPPPRNRQHVASYARAINACLKSTPAAMQLSIRLPIYDASSIRPPDRFVSPSTPPGRPQLVLSPQIDNSATDSELNATWEMWDIIRSVCAYNTRLTIALDLAPPLPSVLGILSKWTAEPVKFILLPASTFIANTKGYPVLPKGTQSFIRNSMIHRPTIVLSDTQSKLHTYGGEVAYSQYVKHLEKTSPIVKAAKQEGTVENFANGYQDYLQAPLQPLMDNLQSITYHTFEQCPVKYDSYEEAMYRALMDWPASDRIVFCVAGAGRGPLVARCLAAIKRSKKNGFIYAVEKNPNAYVTLQQRQKTEWTSSKVELIYGDMRMIHIPEQVDMLVSELLGSFGDNELSPECLDGAVRFLKPNGISIPSSYTAHLAPLSSSKLYNEARSSKDDKGVETPYVVMLQAIDLLSDEGGGRCGPKIQECWEFEHPRRDAVLDERGLPLTNSHNVRSSRLRFHIPHASVMHGFGGYFEAVLYGSVGLSIHPHRKDHISKDMLSWFPIFFPLKDPLYLPGNSELEVSIWRLTDERRVWYEWYAEAFLPVLIAPSPATFSSALFPPITGSPPSVLLSPSSSFNGVPSSPLADAEDAPRRLRNDSTDSSFGSLLFPELPRSGSPKATSGVVKISQTQLHNPGGRSSWIGL